MNPSRSTPRLAMKSGASGFAAKCGAYLVEYLDKIKISIAELDESQVWWRPTPSFNSIGNLLLHLHGNLSLWVLKTLGGRDFERRRNAEFSDRETATSGEMLDRLADVVEACASVAGGLGPAELETRYEVQGYPVSGEDVLLHVVEHMAYHTGQIVQTAKQLLLDQGSIEFYPHHASE